MESAKKNLQVLAMSPEAGSRKEEDIPLTISAGLKIQALGKGDLLSDLRRPSLLKSQEVEKKVGKSQIVNKLNFINK